jgi:hypothetical protein
MGQVISIGYVGQLVGAIGLNWLAERFGRLRMLLLALGIIAALTVATAFAGNYMAFMVLRLIQGSGAPCRLGDLMVFTKRLREPIMRGEVTCSVRISQRPHLKIDGRYPLGPGVIHVISISEIGFEDITSDLDRRSGFQGVVDLLKVAKHGTGENIYPVEFEYQA